ncbi:amino acid ABC transporter substrate-binding protein [Butyrivibrio fibrisolvens]|uniref:Amino acid ABC transporter substrate-binding protein n=1 Tax=Butyrivibrio fibrisolvens TaxID=831 RepID=A0A317G351_BUTFI|nr:amino acid ABC transporter substrate-binding protein [Butyrivibrio fibrisolvens]PWT28378.1 amino acid ABC transporter substrate-binding protein [Butyrivibrio fibrisolvens]
MKRLTSLLLIAALGIGGLTSCSSKAAQSQNESANTQNSSADNQDTSDGQSTTYDKILEQGYITFATEGTYAPYSYHDDDNNLVGFDVEVAQKVAEKLGVEARFTETQWDGIIAGLDAQKYDAIANQVSITPERQEKYLFSTPYTYVYGAVIVSGDNEDISSFEDLDGKDVALTVTSNWAEVAQSYGGNIVSTSGFSESIQLVIQGRADATVNDNVTFLDFKANQADANVKIVATSQDSTQSAILIRQEDTALQEAINKALEELRADGTLAELSVKYFGEDITIEK